MELQGVQKLQEFQELLFPSASDRWFRQMSLCFSLRSATVGSLPFHFLFTPLSLPFHFSSLPLKYNGIETNFKLLERHRREQ